MLSKGSKDFAQFCSSGEVHAFKGDLGRALKWAENSLARAESNLVRARSLLNLIFIYEEAGQSGKAKRKAAEFRTLQPTFTLENYRKLQPYRNEEDWERFAGALRKAGIS